MGSTGLRSPRGGGQGAGIALSGHRCHPSHSHTVESCWKCDGFTAAKVLLLKALTLNHWNTLHEAGETTPENFSAQHMTSVVYDWQHFARICNHLKETKRSINSLDF